MTTDWLPPEEDLKDLYEAERRRPGPENDTEARVKQAVLLSIAAGAAVGSGAAVATKAAVAAGAGSMAATTTATSSVATSSVAAGASSGAALTTLSGAAALAKPAVVVIAAVIATAGGGVFVANYEPEAEAAHIVVVEPERPRPPEGLVLPPPPPPQKVVIGGGAIGRNEFRQPVKRDDAAPTSIKAPTVPIIEQVVDPVVDSPVEANRIETDVVARAAALAAERGIIAEARTALKAGNANGALIALEGHRNDHPRGALTEEREALIVLALVQAGRGAEAQAKAKAFASTWPTSLFRQALEDALSATPTP